MLNKRKPSQKNVETWVQKLASDPSTPVQSVQRITAKRLRLGMRNDVSEYNMDITDQGHQYSYGTTLTPDIEGPNQAACYGEILELNSKINGTRIGREDGYLTLTREDPKEGLGPLAVSRSIREMDKSQKFLVPKLHQITKKNNGRFRKSN
jgi:hypothetical protein